MHITKGRTHSVRFYGHGEDDWVFISEILPRIIKHLYNKEVKAKKSNDSNKCVLNVCSKVIATFKQSLGLSVGKKKLNDLPDFVKHDKILLINCIRGIADTDFSLYFKKNEKDKYVIPEISCAMDNKQLIQNIAEYLKNLGFKINLRLDVKRIRKEKELTEHHLIIHGRKNLEKWMSTIGFYNPKHLTKYEVWKMFGYCNPKTRTDERIKILSASSTQRVDPVELYYSLIL